MKKQLLILLLVMNGPAVVFCQPTTFSLATDLSVQHSFKKGQRYSAIGQTVHFHFHFTNRDGAYAWVSYYGEGTFTNNLTAIAKSPLTLPQQVNYRNKAAMRYKHISFGWKHYLLGVVNSESKNLYAYSGFGLMLGRVINTHDPIIDGAMYELPVTRGKGNFARLTFDLGLGGEVNIGGDIYVYLEAKALIPTTDYPTRYLLVNDNAPFMGSANAGVRIHFE